MPRKRRQYDLTKDDDDPDATLEDDGFVCTGTSNLDPKPKRKKLKDPNGGRFIPASHPSTSRAQPVASTSSHPMTAQRGRSDSAPSRGGFRGHDRAVNNQMAKNPPSKRPYQQTQGRDALPNKRTKISQRLPDDDDVEIIEHGSTSHARLTLASNRTKKHTQKELSASNNNIIVLDDSGDEHVQPSHTHAAAATTVSHRATESWSPPPLEVLGLSPMIQTPPLPDSFSLEDYDSELDLELPPVLEFQEDMEDEEFEPVLEFQEDVDFEYGSDSGQSGPTEDIVEQMMVDSDGESDDSNGAIYERMHAGYDLHGPSWIPLIIEELDELSISGETVPSASDPPPFRSASPKRFRPILRHDVSRSYPLRTLPPPYSQWDELGTATNVGFYRRPRLAVYTPGRPVPHTWAIDFEPYANLNKTHSFKECSGPVNKVEQRGPWTIVGDATPGGGADYADEVRVPFNNRALLSWRDGVWRTPNGHERFREHLKSVKYYTVHDVKFAPNQNIFVSTGADKKMIIWTLEMYDPNQYTAVDSIYDDAYPAQEAWVPSYISVFKSLPYEIIFKPDSTIFAVGAKSIYLFDLEKFEEDRSGRLGTGMCLMPSNAVKTHTTGGMAWGLGPTRDRLFAVTEPATRIFEGFHKAFDTHRMDVLYTFDAQGAGDCIAADGYGERLAISTQEEEKCHVLRLYDIRRSLPQAIQKITLEPFPQPDEGPSEGECNMATFSPDGIYIALARSDNRTHVYDSRMLGRGLIFDYVHKTENTPQGEHYGVVKAQWITAEATGRMALLTGGEDGCVRLWNPDQATNNPNNGQSVASVSSDVAHFSVGDPSVGEHRLVVGGCDGEVSVFDRAPG